MTNNEFELERFDNKGLVKLLGQRVIIFFGGTFRELAVGMREVLGDEAGGVLYDAGIHSGKCSTQILLYNWKEKGKEFIKKWEDFYGSAGVGWFRIKKINIDLKTGVGNIIIRRSIFADDIILPCESTFNEKSKKSKDPSCHFLAGFFVGVFETITGQKIECEEVKCVKKGDTCCEFELSNY